MLQWKLFGISFKQIDQAIVGVLIDDNHLEIIALLPPEGIEERDEFIASSQGAHDQGESHLSSKPFIMLD